MKSVPIHIDPIHPAKTTNALVHQHPSWKAAAIWLLEQIIIKMSKWKMNNTKLILIILLAPRQAVFISASVSFGHDG